VCPGHGTRPRAALQHAPARPCCPAPRSSGARCTDSPLGKLLVNSGPMPLSHFAYPPYTPSPWKTACPSGQQLYRKLGLRGRQKGGQGGVSGGGPNACRQSEACKRQCSLSPTGPAEKHHPTPPRPPTSHLGRPTVCLATTCGRGERKVMLT